PQLSSVQLGDDYKSYSFGGNNTIINNGGEGNEEEVYLSGDAKPEFEGGHNNITDLRSGETELMESEQQCWLNLTGNYLGEDWETRIININTEGTVLLNTPTDYEYTSAFMEIAEEGKAIDTVYEVNQVIGSLSGEEALYSIGEGYYLQGENLAAIPYFNQIVDSWQNARLAVQSAYRLITIYREMETYTDSIISLENYLGYREQQSGEESEKIAIRYLESLCQITRGEYVMAEDKINVTVQNNWGEERGYFAGINLELISMLGMSANSPQTGTGGIPQGIDKGKELRQKKNNLLKSKYGIGKGNITEKITPEAVEVFNNYPNPFGGESNKITRIKFGVPYRAMTELSVFDILGRTVGEIIPRGYKDAGYYEAEFNGAGYASGVYFYRLTVGEKQIIKKMILAK
ncbi:MAG: T9SS type A sorting domain-containing protein, partial [Ignavibacteriaceae bacterium]|nr:T9SS type A sorting domain-containing protein [Ignavibacteriaceae bacterium]